LQLAEAPNDGIDLLLTDVIMPEMNGAELAVRLRAIFPRLKCLFMSGYTADVIAHHGILEKDVNFIQKPYSIAELALKVRATINRG
jgi:two-component system cell cycle sensor histidine kinase/response regulator CckA